MTDSEQGSDSTGGGGLGPQVAPSWKPIAAKLRRLLGVMLEKARTTPDAYPLTLSGLVTGANQKSNRHPIMNLTSEQVEDGLAELRRLGAAAEVHASGRVPKYRHYGYNWLGVKGVEAAVMTELLLRGEQTTGDLRVRASRFDPIPDLGTLQGVLKQLMDRNLVIALTPAGRGQVFTHNLYLADELAALRNKFAGHTGEEDASEHNQSRHVSHAPGGSSGAGSSHASGEISELRDAVTALRETVEEVEKRIARLESLIDG